MVCVVLFPLHQKFADLSCFAKFTDAQTTLNQPTLGVDPLPQPSSSSFTVPVSTLLEPAANGMTSYGRSSIGERGLEEVGMGELTTPGHGLDEYVCFGCLLCDSHGKVELTRFNHSPREEKATLYQMLADIAQSTTK